MQIESTHFLHQQHYHSEYCFQCYLSSSYNLSSIFSTVDGEQTCITMPRVFHAKGSTTTTVPNTNRKPNRDTQKASKTTQNEGF